MTYKLNIRTEIIRVLVVIVSITSSIYVVMQPTVENGLQYLFLLPLSLGIFSMILGDIFIKFKENIALFIIFSIIILRYIVSPVLVSSTGHTVTAISPTKEGYYFALIMMIIELFFIMLTVKIYWKNITPGIESKNRKKNDFHLTSFGFLTLLLIIVIVVIRGNIDNVISHLSFFLNFRYEETPLYTYDMSALMIVKTMIFLSLSSWAYKKYLNRKSISKYYYMFLIILFAGFNIMIFDARLRSVLAQTIIATTAVLVYLFPKNRKKFITSFFLLAILVIGINFIFGTLRYDLYINDSSYVSLTFLENISEKIELYTANVSTMAHSYDAYSYIRSGMSELTIFSDIIRSLGIITYPGLRTIYNAFGDVPTTASLFMNSLNGKAFIMTTAGLSIYHGTFVLGWIINILTYIFMIKFIYFFHVKQKTSHNIAKIYVYSYIQVVAALLLINNLFIFLQGVTGLILLLYLVIVINGLTRKGDKI